MTRLKVLLKKELYHLVVILKAIWAYFTGSAEQYRHKRESICIGCEYYDHEGKTKNVVIRGKPACSLCGCNIKLLTSSKESDCSRKEELNQEPLWQHLN